MSYILTLPYPQGHMMTVKCKQPLDEFMTIYSPSLIPISLFTTQTLNIALYMYLNF